jgi:hypothetical protein
VILLRFPHSWADRHAPPHPTFIGSDGVLELFLQAGLKLKSSQIARIASYLAILTELTAFFQYPEIKILPLNRQHFLTSVILSMPHNH